MAKKQQELMDEALHAVSEALATLATIQDALSTAETVETVADLVANLEEAMAVSGTLRAEVLEALKYARKAAKAKPASSEDAEALATSDAEAPDEDEDDSDEDEAAE